MTVTVDYGDTMWRISWFGAVLMNFFFFLEVVGLILNEGGTIF